MDLDSVRSGTITSTLPLDQPMGWVDPRDIGDVAVARLLSTDWSGRVVQAVHGPVDLDYRQVAEILGRALDRPVRAVQVSDDDVREVLRGAGMTEPRIEALVGMSAGLRDGFRTGESAHPGDDHADRVGELGAGAPPARALTFRR